VSPILDEKKHEDTIDQVAVAIHKEFKDSIEKLK